MRDLGTLASADASTSRPAFFVVIHDASTLQPSAVLCENLLTEELAGVVWFQTIPFNVDAILTDLKVKGTRPQQLGAGLIRREASFSVLSNQNTLPYINGVLTKAVWSGGKSTDSVVFSIWGIDVASIVNNDTKDITKGICFGYFRLDSSTSWDEQSRTCNFNLIDVLISDERVVAATTNAGARTLLSFNSSYNSKVVPTVYGAVKRVKTLRGYPDISLVDGKSGNLYFSGVVGESYTAFSSYIVLEQPSYDSSILRQLIESGVTSVRVRMEDDEIISGILSYDSGNNRVLLASVTRNTHYYTGKAYTETLASETAYEGQPKPGDYDLYQGYYQRVFALSYYSTTLTLTDAITAYSGILWNTSEIAKSGYGYIGLHASFPGSDISDKFVFAKLSGMSAVLGTPENKTNTAQMVIETDIAKGAYNTSTRFSSAPSGSTADDVGQVAIGSYTINGLTAGVVKNIKYTDSANTEWFAGVRNSVNKSTPYDQITLYFKNPALGAGSGTANVTKWSLIHWGSAISYNHYINDGFTYIDSSTKIYGTGDDGLVEIPSSFVIAKETGINQYGYSTLIRIKLSTPPTGMGIGLTSNDLYIDTNYRSGWGADRHRIIFELLNQSLLANYVAQSNLNPNSYTGSADTSIALGFVCSGETYSEMLDKIFFQIGENLKWNTSGCVDWYSTVQTFIDGAGLWTGNVINANDLYDNTSALHLSKFKSIAVDDVRDALPYYLEVYYGAWMDPFYTPIDNKDSIGPDEVYLNYAFDCIQTKDSATTCVSIFKKLGSPSGIYASGRQISLTGGIQQLAKYEPLDCALVNNYPSITDDAAFSSIMHRSGSSIQYDLVASNFILQGVCVIDSVEYSLSIDNVSVVITAFVSQKEVDARGIKLGDPPSKLGKAKDSANDSGFPDNSSSANIAGGLGGSSLPPGDKNSVLIVDENDDIIWRTVPAFAQSGVFAYSNPTDSLDFVYTGGVTGVLVHDPVTRRIEWRGATGDYMAMLIGDTDASPFFGKITGDYIDATTIPCICAIQLVNNAGTSSNQVPGDSVLNSHKLYGTTLTFDCSEAYNPVKIALTRNVTPDSGLINGDDIEIAISLNTHSISSLHLVQMPAASIWCNPAAVTADSAISVSALDNTMIMRKSGGLVWDKIDTDQIKDLAITGDKIDGGQVQNYHIVSLDWSKLTSVPSSFTPGAHASTHYKGGSDALSIPTTNSFCYADSSFISGLLNSRAVNGIPWQVSGTAPSIAYADEEIEIYYDGVSYNHIRIKDNSIVDGKIVSVAWSKITGFPGVTLSGDVTGATSANTVTKIQGYPVSSANPNGAAGGTYGGSLLQYSQSAGSWNPVKVFASADYSIFTCDQNNIPGAIVLGVYNDANSYYLGSVQGKGDGSFGYLLGIDEALNVQGKRPKWLRNVILGQGQLAAGSTAGRMRIVCGGDGDLIDMGIGGVAAISMYDRSISSSTPLVTISLSSTPTGGWSTTKALTLREVDVCDNGVAKKMMILASAPY